MKLLERLRRSLNGSHVFTMIVLAAVAVSWPALGGVALAQDDVDDVGMEPVDEADYPGQSDGEDKKDEGPSGPKYVGSYAIVILCIGLGVMLVCRSANRHELTKKWKPTGLTGAGDEEEEGAEQEGPAARTKKPCKEAQVGLGFSIAGLLPVVGIFLGGYGLWKSLQAKKMIARNKLLTGEGQAMAGIIIGPIAIVISLVLTVVIAINLAS